MKKTIIAMILALAITILIFILFETKQPSVVIDNNSSSEEISSQNNQTQLIEISSGYQGIALALDPLKGVGGFIEPGSYIDIYTTEPIVDATQDQPIKTKLLFKHVEVLAVGNMYKQDTSMAMIAENVTVQLPKQDMPKMVDYVLKQSQLYYTLYPKGE